MDFFGSNEVEDSRHFLNFDPEIFFVFQKAINMQFIKRQIKLFKFDQNITKNVLSFIYKPQNFLFTIRKNTP